MTKRAQGNIWSGGDRRPVSAGGGGDTNMYAHRYINLPQAVEDQNTWPVCKLYLKNICKKAKKNINCLFKNYVNIRSTKICQTFFCLFVFQIVFSHSQL